MSSKVSIPPRTGPRQSTIAKVIITLEKPELFKKPPQNTRRHSSQFPTHRQGTPGRETIEGLMNGTGRNGPLIQERTVDQGEVFSAVLGLLALARQIDW